MKIISMIFSFIAVFQIVYFIYTSRKKKDTAEAYIMPDLYSFDEEESQPETKEKKRLLESIKSLLSGVNKQLFKRWGIKRSIDKQLVRLGHSSHLRAEDVLIFKEIAVVLGLGGAYFLLYNQMGITNPIILIGFVILVFFIPDFFLRKKAQIRMENIRTSLPGVVDLLTLCVEAGLDFMSAFERIITKKARKKDPLIEEINVMINEIRIGSTRREALRNLTKRVGIPEVNAFVSVLLQTEELGTDLVDIMRDYAEEMRTKRLQMAEKKAAQIGTKMLFPMIIFIFPMTFVIILVPLVIKYLTGGM